MTYIQYTYNNKIEKIILIIYHVIHCMYVSLCIHMYISLNVQISLHIINILYTYYIHHITYGFWRSSKFAHPLLGQVWVCLKKTGTQRHPWKWVRIIQKQIPISRYSKQ